MRDCFVSDSNISPPFSTTQGTQKNRESFLFLLIIRPAGYRQINRHVSVSERKTFFSIMNIYEGTFGAKKKPEKDSFPESGDDHDNHRSMKSTGRQPAACRSFNSIFVPPQERDEWGALFSCKPDELILLTRGSDMP